MKCRLAKQYCTLVGMSVSKDGLAFTVMGGRLTSGQEAPEWIASLNGCTVEEAVPRIAARLGEESKKLKLN